VKDVPGSYYRRLAEVDDGHWWTRGMLELVFVMLEPWLEQKPRAVLDAGCGAGAFLALAGKRVPSAALYGVDLSPEAIDIAQGRVPAAELFVAPLSALPLADHTVDIVVTNDVQQHIDEAELPASMAEVRRVLRSTGVLLVRTNGARRGRRERSDWRLYDADSLLTDLMDAGFEVRRMTYANLLFSAVAELRGRGPRPPTETWCGIPTPAGLLETTLGGATLALEAAIVGRGGQIPWGHSLVAIAVPR
jgi:SAM-dependent methyltransferase